ncbi:MAG TPA: TfoX/Sxy family protein [bacterium]|nr:TfoX/Sxy family protein [bacterium]
MEDSSFKDFILDQLNALGGVVAKRMFGAYGLYCDDVFFGIIDETKLYFKTSPDSRKAYKTLGSGPFFYYRKDKTGKKRKAYLKTYYEVPADILEDGDRLVVWAKRAVDAQAQTD